MAGQVDGWRTESIDCSVPFDGWCDLNEDLLFSLLGVYFILFNNTFFFESFIFLFLKQSKILKAFLISHKL